VLEFSTCEPHRKTRLTEAGQLSPKVYGELGMLSSLLSILYLRNQLKIDSFCVLQQNDLFFGGLHIYQLLFYFMTKAEMITDKGTMLIEFYDEDAPGTVKNFVDLSKKGFYDGLIFHRVIPDFMIQGGDPTGTGRGGPGYKIKCELSGGNQYHDRGVLSMAHAGRDTGGSQFFICHSRNNTAHLDGNHTCFGKVVEGVDTVDLIRQGDKIQKITIIEEEA
jgi:peptidyl-prolyl cis-trans isomerase B (cyclophilin B)